MLLLLFVAWGIYSFSKLSIDALPDITNNQVQVITNSPNLATQEVEQFITYPLEMEFKSLQNLTELRSTSRNGLSVITIVFKDNVPVNIARQMVAEKIKLAEYEIPKEYGVPEMIPPTTGLGEIFQYVVVAKKGFEKNYTTMDLRTTQDWIIKRQLLGTPGVVDVSSFGGLLKQYEISVKPDRLAAMNLTLAEVFAALKNNNGNTGGSYIDKGPNMYFIRGEGMIQNMDDINNIVVQNKTGIPILIKDIATVQWGFANRFGALTRNGNGETVGAVVLMQKGENAVKVIQDVKEKMKVIEKSLPEGLAIDVFVDRTKLIDRTIHTVQTNLLEGALIVLFVLILFLGNLRAGLIVASVIPLAMLFAVSMMNLIGISANLMSMGALDFGLIVDGAVIIVESLLHRLHKHYKGSHLSTSSMDKEVTASSTKIMSSAVFGQIIILIVYIPIFVLRGIEGKMFMPMAQTVSFAIIGALLLSVTYVPLVSSIFLSRNIADRESFTDRFMKKMAAVYQPVLVSALRNRLTVLGISLALFIGAFFLFRSLGGEFIPELDEGDFAMNYTIRQGSSLPQTMEVGTRLEKIALSFPEVKEVVSKIGTSEVPTDPMPLESADMIMVLKDKKEWTTAKDKEGLAEKMNEKMSVIPGVNMSFEQPIQMRFNELIAGVKSDIAIKIFGYDLDQLFTKANEAARLINGVEGLTDIKVEQTVGMPQLVVKYDRDKIAQYGLNIQDVNTLLNTAYAGGLAGVVYEGERKFDLVVRIPKDGNTDADALKALLIPISNGSQIPLSEIATVQFVSSPAQISREDAERRIVIEANVRGRDVETVVKEIRETLQEKLKLPEGYYITYGGQFQNLQEAKSRLLLAVPVALLLIFFLLFIAFRSAKEALIIFSAIPLAAIGGIVALWLRDMHFSISAGIGFIALFGVAVLNGIVLINYYNRLRDEGETHIEQRILKGSLVRLRPVLATAAVASLGFLPMALSTHAGAEVQKPLATVVIGGLVSSTLLTLFVLPVLYSLFYLKRNNMKKQRFITPFLIGILCFGGLRVKAQNTMTIDSALQRAYNNHSMMQQGKLLIRQQEALVQSVAAFDPLSINGSYGQINSALADYTIDLTQTFKLPGAYRAEKNVLRENVQVAKITTTINRNELTKNVMAAYYNWLYAWQYYALLDSLSHTYKDFELNAFKKYQAGEAGILEKTRAQAQLAEVEMQKKQAWADVVIYENALQQWTTWPEKPVPPKTMECLPMPVLQDSLLLENNPLLTYAEQQNKLQSAVLKMEKAKTLPTISLGISTQSIDHVSSFQVFHAGINIPIFQAGIQSKIQAADLGIQIAGKEMEKTKRQLTASFFQLYQQATKAAEQIKYYQQDGLQYATTMIEAATKNYQSGNIDYLEYVLNLKEATLLKAGYLAAINDCNQAIIQLNYLIHKEK